MNKFIILLTLITVTASLGLGSSSNDIFPVRGLCIAAPDKESLDEFIKFIREELAPMKVNTLVLRIDYNFAYKSHPELQAKNPLTEPDVKKIVNSCRTANIRLIPQVNLLGHQSWASSLGALLREYPEFDETPHVKMPEEYSWPNDDGLYCKSYCPLHPDVHKVVFAIVDEVIEVFEADAFHAGMDEVFYIGDDKCPRCGGRDKAELFAGEVTLIRNHLAASGKELWIWGDRLLDGKATGLGMWEASMNNTHRAIDMIPKDVVINDWHYERADPTAAIFALKGFRVVTCPWRLPEVAVRQLDLMLAFRKDATDTVRENYLGMMQTIWTSAPNFLDMYYGRAESKSEKGDQLECFKILFREINQRMPGE